MNWGRLGFGCDLTTKNQNLTEKLETITTLHQNIVRHLLGDKHQNLKRFRGLIHLRGNSSLILD